MQISGLSHLGFLDSSSSFTGLGAAIRDSSGKVVAVVSKFLAGSFSIKVGEALAFREGLLLAQNLGCPVSWVECDAANVVRAIVDSDLNFGLASPIFLDVKALCRIVGVVKYGGIKSCKNSLKSQSYKFTYKCTIICNIQSLEALLYRT
ncbi:hypothetical protein ACOSQ3_028806 [Xanthoceras sorbifolium]